MPDELPKWFDTQLQAAAYADKLRTAGDLRPMRVIPVGGGRAKLIYDDEGDQNNDDKRADQ